MPDYKETKVDIGPESAFSKFPTPVDIGQWSYFLSKGKKGYRLLSNVCPTRWEKCWIGAACSCARIMAGVSSTPKAFASTGPTRKWPLSR